MLHGSGQGRQVYTMLEVPSDHALMNMRDEAKFTGAFSVSVTAKQSKMIMYVCKFHNPTFGNELN